jgi:hypothetical protein
VSDISVDEGSPISLGNPKCAEKVQISGRLDCSKHSA